MTPAGRGPFGLGALNDLLGEPGAGGLVAGRFSLEREAAVGGMGVVYRGRDENADCPVALKRRGPACIGCVEQPFGCVHHRSAAFASLRP